MPPKEISAAKSNINVHATWYKTCIGQPEKGAANGKWLRSVAPSNRPVRRQRFKSHSAVGDAFVRMLLEKPLIT